MLFMPWTLHLCPKGQMAQTSFSFGLTWGFSIPTPLPSLGHSLRQVADPLLLDHRPWVFPLQAASIPGHNKKMSPGVAYGPWEGRAVIVGESTALLDGVDHFCSAVQMPGRLALQLVDETHDSYVDLLQDLQRAFKLPNSLLHELGCVDFMSFLLRFWLILKCIHLNAHLINLCMCCFSRPFILLIKSIGRNSFFLR